MAITYSFEIVRITTIDTDSHTKVVKQIEYRYKGLDEDTGISYTVNNNIELDTDTIEGFIDYESLTEETVLQWVSANTHEDVIRDWNNSIDIHIARTIAERSKTVQTKLPWETTQ